jgi:hypothetical protein
MTGTTNTDNYNQNWQAYPGMKVVCINDKGIIKMHPLKKGNIYTIREVFLERWSGSAFHAGLHLEEVVHPIQLCRIGPVDLDYVEMSYSKRRFKPLLTTKSFALLSAFLSDPKTEIQDGTEEIDKSKKKKTTKTKERV